MKCPYCGDRFEDRYYFANHVPCPSPAGDVSRKEPHPMFDLKDFRLGQRVELHPATDLWMRGARYAEVVAIGRKHLHLRLDGTPRKVVRVTPRHIATIVE